MEGTVAVEYEVLESGAWSNNRRRHEPIGNTPPAVLDLGEGGYWSMNGHTVLPVGS